MLKKDKARIINKQFELINEDIRWEDIPEDGMIVRIVNKKEKSIPWYELYKFSSAEQYDTWEKWALEEMKKLGCEKEFDKLNMCWGLTWNFKPQGQLF